ncbi:MAG: single-stranded DNA-binding protein [Actinobacteria bacterium]|nr:MAG: single-stranded DNA-binding protein [Actinomycetota bacterium]
MAYSSPSNCATLVGRLTRDPELRSVSPSAGARSVLTLRLAVRKPIKPDEDAPSADFFDVTVWGPLAETCAAHLRKARLVPVSARLEPTAWEAADGAKRRGSISVRMRSSVSDAGELRPQVQEYARIEAAARVLADSRSGTAVGNGRARRRRARKSGRPNARRSRSGTPASAPKPPKGAREPRGANQVAIVQVLRERAAMLSSAAGCESRARCTGATGAAGAPAVAVAPEPRAREQDPRGLSLHGEIASGSVGCQRHAGPALRAPLTRWPRQHCAPAVEHLRSARADHEQTEGAPVASINAPAARAANSAKVGHKSPYGLGSMP